MHCLEVLRNVASYTIVITFHANYAFPYNASLVIDSRAATSRCIQVSKRERRLSFRYTRGSLLYGQSTSETLMHFDCFIVTFVTSDYTRSPRFSLIRDKIKLLILMIPTVCSNLLRIFGNVILTKCYRSLLYCN